MRYVKHCMVLVLLGACKTGPSQAAVYSASAEQEVLSAEQAWVDATVRKDADTFASLMDDSWVGFVEGRLVEKSEWRNSIRAHTARRDSVQTSNVKVRFPTRDIAVVSADFVTRSRTGTGPRVQVTMGHYMNTWKRIGERWQLVSSGFSTQPKSS
jgi:ketosteroid isomerase-like protein